MQSTHDPHSSWIASSPGVQQPAKHRSLGYSFSFAQSDKTIRLRSADVSSGTLRRPPLLSFEPLDSHRRRAPATLAPVRLSSADLDSPFFTELFELTQPSRKRRLSDFEKKASILRMRSTFLEQGRRIGTREAPDIEDMVDFRDRLDAVVNRLGDYNIDQFRQDLVREASVLRLRHFLPDQESGRTGSRGFKRAWEAVLLEDFRLAPDLGALAVRVGSHLRATIERLVYLGPLREYPERHYIFSGNSAARDVGKSGDHLPDVLFNRPELVSEVNQVLTQFEIPYSISVHQLDDPDVEDVFALRLIDKRSSTSVSVLDVGFGISQVLPVIVQSLLSTNSVIVIEQPEIHLHPRLQAELGDLFVASIGNKNQFLIETHSEHLILRLQRLIRSGRISSRDVSVIYISRNDEGSSAIPLRLDDRGDFVDRWPDGFFEDGFRELFDLC